MKVILQDFEPRSLVAATVAQVPARVRKTRLRLDRVKADNRLFHAL